MKTFHLLGLAVFAILALSAVVASTASAEFLLAEWLWEGNHITSALLVESSGELLLEDSGTGIDILCSGILDGFVEPESLDLITELLDLTGLIAISLTALVEPGLACESHSSLCVEPLVWAVNLPWETELELEEPGGNYLVLILGNPGWYVVCMLTFGTPTDECTASEGAFEVDNNVGGTPNALFSEAITELAGLKLATCLMVGPFGELETLVETGIVEGEGLITHSGGGVISVSSE
jgi:hypothetical protein